MEKINIICLNPANDSEMKVEICDSTTVSDIINELITSDFIPDIGLSAKYGLYIKGNLIFDSQNLINSGAKDGLWIQVGIELIEYEAMGGSIDLYGMWQIAYPYIDQISTVLGIVGGMVGFGVWLKNRFDGTYYPDKLTRLITNKETWNLCELSKKLDIPNNEIKYLLKGYGYQWDSKTLLYHKTDKTIEIVDKINDINYDI